MRQQFNNDRFENLLAHKPYQGDFPIVNLTRTMTFQKPSMKSILRVHLFYNFEVINSFFFTII